MKNLILIVTIVAGFGLQSVAQKFAYIDSDYVLQHVPAFMEAQQELNKLSSDWQTEIELKHENIRKLEDAYKAEKILLPGEMQKKREEEIKARKDEAREMQKAKFGVGGELFSKREELIKPIQDEIYEAIADVCTSKGYMVIFDKSNNSNMLYTNPKYDVSDSVIKKMGLTPGETIEGESEEVDDKGGSKGGSGKDSGKSGGSKGDRSTKGK